MDALGEIEAMTAAVNGTAKKRRRRKATIDNTPKIANEAIEAESCIGNLRDFRINVRDQTAATGSSSI